MAWQSQVLQISEFLPKFHHDLLPFYIQSAYLFTDKFFINKFEIKFWLHCYIFLYFHNTWVFIMNGDRILTYIFGNIYQNIIKNVTYLLLVINEFIIFK